MMALLEDRPAEPPLRLLLLLLLVLSQIQLRTRPWLLIPPPCPSTIIPAFLTLRPLGTILLQAQRKPPKQIRLRFGWPHPLPAPNQACYSLVRYPTIMAGSSHQPLYNRPL
jgi:hypothetical protein